MVSSSGRAYHRQHPPWPLYPHVRVTNILCRCVQPAPQTVYLEQQRQQLAASAATAEAAAPLAAVGLEYQSCLHRATGLHHWLRRSANHRQPLPSSCSPLCLFLVLFVLAPPQPSALGGLSAKNMNITRCPADTRQFPPFASRLLLEAIGADSRGGRGQGWISLLEDWVP